MHCIDPRPLRLRRSPATGRGIAASRGDAACKARWPTGRAGSAAIAWKSASLVALIALAGCGAPRAPAPVVAAPANSVARPTPPTPLTPPVRARNWDEYKVQAGHRLGAANPSGTFTGQVPEPLLAIPVLEIELDANGSVRRVLVQRQPSQAKDTVQLAIDAVHRGAPYGDVSHLSRPWKFSEVFLFRDDRRFKPRALDSP